MMKYLNFFIAIAFILLVGDSLAAPAPGPFSMFMGNPIGMVSDLNNKLSGAGVFGSITKLGFAIGITGFFFKLYAAVGKNNHSEIRGTIVQAIGVAIMLSLVPQVNSALTNSWNSTYNSSNSAFAGALDGKVQEAKVQMTKMLGTVATAASLGAGAGAYSAVAAGESGLVAIGAKGTTSILSRVGSKISASALALSGFTIMYSTIIAIAAFIVLAVGYVLPIAIGFTMWGQVGPIWSCIGSALGAIMVTAFLPMLAYSSIDRAFIQPVAATQQYIESTGIGEGVKNLDAQLIGDTYAASVKGNLQGCMYDQATDEIKNCVDKQSSGFMEGLYSAVAKQLQPLIDNFTSSIGHIITSIMSAVVQVILSILYFIGALVLMGAAVNFLVTVLGGVSSYAGAITKGGG